LSFWRSLPRWFRRLVVSTTGVILLLLGLALTVLPGPGIAIVIAALAVLAVEFTWAHHLLERLRTQTRRFRFPGRSRPLDASLTDLDDQHANSAVDLASEQFDNVAAGQDRTDEQVPGTGHADGGRGDLWTDAPPGDLGR
jgi:hypothetical protein